MYNRQPFAALRADTFQRQVISVLNRSVLREKDTVCGSISRAKAVSRQREHIHCWSAPKTNSEFAATRQRFANFFVALAGEAQTYHRIFTLPSHSVFSSASSFGQALYCGPVKRIVSGERYVPALFSAYW